MTPSLLAPPLSVALAGLLAACGGPTAQPPAAAGPVARVSGTADSVFTGVRVLTSFAARSADRGCQKFSAGWGEWVPQTETARARADVAGGRFAVEVPLAWPERAGCDWRPTALVVRFERGARADDPSTRGGPEVRLGPTGRPGAPAGPEPVPLPDTVRVLCRPAGTVRPVAVPPVACSQALAGGAPSPMPGYRARPEAGDELALVLDVRYVQAYARDAAARYDTTALNRAYGVDH